MEENLRKLQIAELNILKKVTSFLEKNDIRYFINYGTMIGAIRHHGFIPWDDDIDVCIPRPDYERLLQLSKCKVDDIRFTEYRLGNSLSQILQVVDETVIVKTKPFPNSEIVNSRFAWIDIFPIDGMPSSSILRKIHGRRIFISRFFWGLAVNPAPIKTDYVKSSSFTIKKIIYSLGINKLFSRDATFKRLNKLATKYYFDNSSYVVNSASPFGMKDIVPRAWYGKGDYYTFEECAFRGPAKYDDILKHFYGDYMTPPPEGSAARNHHNLVEVVVKDVNLVP